MIKHSATMKEVTSGVGISIHMTDLIYIYIYIIVYNWQYVHYTGEKIYIYIMISVYIIGDTSPVGI